MTQTAHETPMRPEKPRRAGRDAITEQFGQILRGLMQARGHTQMELAAASGLHQACISSYLLGKALPGTEALVALAEHFGVTTDHLLGRDRERSARRGRR